MAKYSPYFRRKNNFHKGMDADSIESEFDNLLKTFNKLVDEVIVPQNKNLQQLTAGFNNSVRMNTITYNEKVYSGLNADYVQKDIDVNTPAGEDLVLANVSEGDTLAFIWVPRKTGFIAVSSDLTFVVKDAGGSFFLGDEIGIEGKGTHEEVIFKTYTQDDVIYYRFEAGSTPFDTGEGKIIALILRKPDVKTLTISPINVGALL